LREGGAGVECQLRADQHLRRAAGIGSGVKGRRVGRRRDFERGPFGARRRATQLGIRKGAERRTHGDTISVSVGEVVEQDAAGVVTPVRWSMIPTEPFAPETAEQSKSTDKNYLFDDMIARLARGPLQWHLIVTIGQPGDVTDDATKPWPADRATVDVGVLTIDRAETEALNNCRDINFDPLVLPSGIEPSDDPLLSTRSAAYSESFRRREGEKKSPSAIQVPVTGKGS